MATATITIAADFLDKLGEEVFNLGADTLKIVLSNTAPASESSNPLSAGNGILANVTQVSYTNYADTLTSDRTMESVTWTAAVLDMADFTISASGGTLATFRYVYLYDDTSASDELICVWDLGSAVALTDGDSVPFTVNASGVLTISAA